jgi:hypothetical protein
MKNREETWADLRGRLRLAAVAKDLGVTRGYLAQWKFVPDKFVIAVSESTGLPLQLLRPDLYPLSDPWDF